MFGNTGELLINNHLLTGTDRFLCKHFFFRKLFSQTILVFPRPRFPKLVSNLRMMNKWFYVTVIYRMYKGHASKNFVGKDIRQYSSSNKSAVYENMIGVEATT